MWIIWPKSSFREELNQSEILKLFSPLIFMPILFKCLMKRPRCSFYKSYIYCVNICIIISRAKFMNNIKGWCDLNNLLRWLIVTFQNSQMLCSGTEGICCRSLANMKVHQSVLFACFKPQVIYYIYIRATVA